jgi:hypothetical protein
MISGKASAYGPTPSPPKRFARAYRVLTAPACVLPKNMLFVAAACDEQAAARVLILTRLWARIPYPAQVRAPPMPSGRVRSQPDSSAAASRTAPRVILIRLHDQERLIRTTTTMFTMPIVATIPNRPDSVSGIRHSANPIGISANLSLQTNRIIEQNGSAPALAVQQTRIPRAAKAAADHDRQAGEARQRYRETSSRLTCSATCRASR